MATFNASKNRNGQYVVATAAAVGLSIVSTVANAALPPGVDTAITGAGTDAAAAGALVLIAVAGIFVIGLVRKVLGK